MNRLLAAAVLATLCPWACAAQTGGNDSLHLRVITTHDLHGALAPRTYDWSDGRAVGGAGALMAVKRAVEAECDCPTVHLDGGDQMQGTLESNLTFGASAVAALNLLGLDAAAVGNHELDWGTDTLLARQAEATYPWLAANVFEKETGRRPPWARPYAILDVDGVRIGVIGYLTSTTGDIVQQSIVAPYRFEEGPDSFRDVFDAVRDARPDFVAVVAHATGDCNGVTRCRGEMVRFVEALDSGTVDVVIGGHEHTPGFGVVKGVPIIRAGSSGRALGVIDLYRAADGTHRFTMRMDTVFVDRVEPDTAIVAVLEPYQRRADSLARRPLVTLAGPLSRSGREYALGRLVADAMRQAAGTDVGLANRGGVRNGLPGGPVTYGDLFLVKPFGNTVVRFELTGRELKTVIEHAIGGGAPDFLSGVRITYDPGRPAGGRIVQALLSDGAEIRDDVRYTLGTSNFLGDGGVRYDMLAGKPRDELGVTVLDALIAHLQGLPQPVVGPGDERTIPVRR